MNAVYAGVGDADNRYYVTREMQEKSPYNRFVKLSSGIVFIETDRFVPVSHCTAQYISQNLILSAGHCVLTEKEVKEYLQEDEVEFNKDQHVISYMIKTYDGNNVKVFLIDTGYRGNGIDELGDWAVWLIPDLDGFGYNENYFDIKIPESTTDVINVGYGWAKIFSDDELNRIRTIYNELVIKNNEKDINDRKNIVDIADLEQEISVQLGTKLSDNKLKASKCKIVFEDCRKIYSKYSFMKKNQRPEEIIKEEYEKFINICNKQGNLRHSTYYPDILATTCDSWQGNSGGGYISDDGNFLYGTCSYGADGLTDSDNTDYMVSAKQFDERIKELIKKYDVKNANEENLAEIPTDLYDGISKTENSDRKTQKLSYKMDVQNLGDELTNAMSDIPNMSNQQLLKFIDKMAEYQEKKERIEQLQQAYDAARAKETSTANKALGAASMAAAGIGGMQLASAISEAKSDEQAEADMRAYLETFRCDYGGGKSYKGGETEIQLPGGNALIEYYGEYMRLANDLKIRKQALGMKPGIESEVVLDASQTGLYDDVSVAPAEGAFTSIYRALTNPDGADAEKLDEQKSDTKTKRNIGIGLTATGVVGGAVGDMIINRDKSNDNTKK
ncbi:MAG: hypothetical protein MJ187_00230 [Alphaproteobacteria bacterium]|nr:hypothetical protein [Alphaproteobacteria bacterium]